MLAVFYQDDHCVAINKPAGMLVHRSWLDRHETEFVLQCLRDQLGQHVYPIHRLDRPTSGVLLFGLDKESAHQLSLQFEQRQVQKLYWAVVRGYLSNANGLENRWAGQIDYPLKQILDKIADSPKIAQINDTISTIPKVNDSLIQSAITDWQCLATSEMPFSARPRYPTSRYSWVALSPHTGRKHQLRRHMKHIFHPIIGDTSYGDHHQNRAIREHIGVSRLMLHARQLDFWRLGDGQPVSVVAPVDNDWQIMDTALQWQAVR